MVTTKLLFSAIGAPSRSHLAELRWSSNRLPSRVIRLFRSWIRPGHLSGSHSSFALIVPDSRWRRPVFKTDRRSARPAQAGLRTRQTRSFEHLIQFSNSHVRAFALAARGARVVHESLAP